MEDQNSKPQEDQTNTANDDGIFNENVRSTARGEHKAADIVSHLKSYENYCHTPLMKAAFHALLDDFETKAYIDDYGARMKYLARLHDVAKEVKTAKQDMEDRSPESLTHRLTKAKEHRSMLYNLEGVLNVPSLPPVDYTTPLERLGQLHFVVKTYTTEQFYKLINQITDDLQSGDDEKLIALRNTHAKAKLTSQLDIEEFKKRAKLRTFWENIVKDDTEDKASTKAPNHHKNANQTRENLKRCLEDIKELS